MPEVHLTLGEFRKQTEDMGDDTLLVIQSHDADFHLGVGSCHRTVVSADKLDHIEYALLDIDHYDDVEVDKAIKNGSGVLAVSLCANSY